MTGQRTANSDFLSLLYVLRINFKAWINGLFINKYIARDRLIQEFCEGGFDKSAREKLISFLKESGKYMQLKI